MDHSQVQFVKNHLGLKRYVALPSLPKDNVGLNIGILAELFLEEAAAGGHHHLVD